MTGRVWRTIGCLSLVAALLFGTVSTRAEDTTAPPPAFSAQVAGRNSICDAIFALASTPHLSVSAKVFLLEQNEDGKTTTQTGTETILMDRATRHLALAETTTNASLRYVCDGASLLGVSGAVSYFRLPLNGNQRTLADAMMLAGAQDKPLSTVARIAIWGTDRFPFHGTMYKSADGTFLQEIPATEQDGWRVSVVQRFRLNLASLPVSIERWETRTRLDNHQVRTSYRVENYTYFSFPQQPRAFQTVSPPGIKETSPPSDALPAPLGPDRADSKARALLARWQRAWTHFTSYAASAHIREWAMAKTPASMPPDGSADREAVMQVQYARPGRLFVYTEPAGKPSNFTTTQTLVSDGEKYAVFFGKKHEDKRGEGAVEDETTLSYRARAIGLHDFSEILPRILDSPQGLWHVAVEAKYRGFLPLPGGGAAEAVTIVQNFSGDKVLRGAQDSGGNDRRQTITLYFDARTGLLLRSEFLQEWLPVNGAASLRDLPPDEHRVADFSDISVNKEPPRNVFSLPAL